VRPSEADPRTAKACHTGNLPACNLYPPGEERVELFLVRILDRLPEFGSVVDAIRDYCQFGYESAHRRMDLIAEPLHEFGASTQERLAERLTIQAPLEAADRKRSRELREHASKSAPDRESEPDDRSPPSERSRRSRASS